MAAVDEARRAQVGSFGWWVKQLIGDGAVVDLAYRFAGKLWDVGKGDGVGVGDVAGGDETDEVVEAEAMRGSVVFH